MIEDLRIECEVLRAQLQLNKKGSCKELAAYLGVNSNSLNMALSGLRNGPGSEQLLTKLRDHLSNLSALRKKGSAISRDCGDQAAGAANR